MVCSTKSAKITPQTEYDCNRAFRFQLESTEFFEKVQKSHRKLTYGGTSLTSCAHSLAAHCATATSLAGGGPLMRRGSVPMLAGFASSVS